MTTYSKKPSDQHSEPMTSVLWVRNIVNALDVLGLDGLGLAELADIDVKVLENTENGIPVSKIVRLWEFAVAESGDPAIGLQAARSFRHASVDVLGYAMMTGPTLKAALERAVRYVGALTSASRLEIIRTDIGYSFDFSLMSGVIDIQRQNHEFVLFTTLRFLRWITGVDLVPNQVTFRHPKPSDIASYEDAFGVTPQFSSPRLSLGFTFDDMDISLLTANEQMAEIHEYAAQQRAIQLGAAENTLRVRQMIVQVLPDGEPTRDEIAAKMAISSRTLQRRLHEENQTFHEILDEVRHNLAERYLANEKLSLSDVANLLGFSNQSSFTRAARRWFEVSPSKLRIQLLKR